MDGQTDAHSGFCPQVRPQMTSVPTLDLPTKMPADELYEPHNADAEADVTSEDAPMFNSTRAGAEADVSGEDAPVVNLPDQEAQSTGPSTDHTHASAAASTDSVNSAPEAAAPPPPSSTHGRNDTKPKKPIRGQALTALPAYRRIQSLKKNAASSDELSAQQWLKFFLADAWEVQTRAMLHVCGPSCWI